MPLFRFHRGDLEESLKTTVIVKDMDELREIIKEYHKSFIPIIREDFSISIEAYPDFSDNFDTRIGWYTQIVSSNIQSKGTFYPEGFMSEPFTEDCA